MVDDFLTDAMTYYGKDKKPNCMVDNSGTNVGFTNVFTAIYGIFSSEEYGTKWAWLKEYIINTATDAKASLEVVTKRIGDIHLVLSYLKIIVLHGQQVLIIQMMN